MESVNEINLSISEFQDINELTAEELEAIAGGKSDWDNLWGGYNSWVGDVSRSFNEGYRDFTQGASAGLNARDVAESNNNYGSGHTLGSAWRTAPVCK